MTSTPTALVCREVFDENSQPSAEEISEYAQQIGIDPTTEGYLLPLARDGLMQALPPPWKAYYDDKLKTHYFYNSETNVTQWDHPLDQVYKNLVIKAKHSSERGDSILDDTCISIQDLVTFEEDAKQITTDRCETKDMEAQDSSIESSLEEEDGTDRKPKSSADVFRGATRKPAVLAPIGRKPLPPVMGMGERKLGDITGLTKKPGESNTFPRTAQTSMAKFKVGMLQQRDFNDGSFDNSDSDTHDSYSKKGSDAKRMNVPLAPSNVIKKHTPEIIDLSFNPSGRHDSASRDGSSLYDAPKRGLTLSGGGSIFLKSNKSSQQNDNDNISFGSFGKTSSSNTGDNPKGILRERSFGESAFRIPSLDKSEGSRGNDHTVSEEDRKSVRFNLDQKEADFQYDYSPSPSSNSSSDILQGKQGSVIAVNKVEMAKAEPPSASNVALARRNSDTSGLNSETPTFLKARKLRPLKSEDNIKVKPSVPTSGITVFRDQSFTEENKLDSSATNSPARKLIKPLPGDFIKPSLFQKPFEKLSDILKPTSPDTDSDSEVLVNRPKPPVIKNKLSINLMESVDSEASVESPDKESVNLETTSSYDYPKVVEKPNNLSLSLLAEKKKATEMETNKIGARESFRRSSVSRMSAFGDFNSEKSEETKKLESELAVKRDREIVEAKIKMEAELKKTRAELEEQHRREIFILKEQLHREHANNKAKLEKAIKETKENQDKIVEQALNELLADFDKVKDRAIEEEKSKLSIDLSSQIDQLREEHSNSIERLKDENKTNLQKVINNMEHENNKAINELGQQYADNLEAEKLRLMAENKSALDKMKNEHESLCDELKKDYRSEIELVRSQQAAHLSALRERMRREREHPLSASAAPGATGPPSPPREEVAYERLRCDKRLLEDKYRCLKEKYARLKSDVKISIERRNKRREQSLTTGSETEKSHSNKIVVLGDKSGDITDALNSINKMDPRKRILSNNNNPVNGALRLTNNGVTKAEMHAKPHDNNNATPILINPSRDINLSLSDSTPHHNGSGINNHLLNVAGRNDSLNRISPDRSRVKSSSFREKSPLGKVTIREKSFGNGDNDNSLGLNDISLSQSDSHTVSNSRHAKKVQLIDNHKDKYSPKDGADSRSKGALRKSLKINPEYIETTVTDYQDSSDTGISDHLQGRESLLGRNRKKLFTRLKSASTSRLNYTVSPKSIDSSCSPLENLRQQLRKLEELEEQFPDVTLNADTTAYRLRYPFPDSGGGGELGFLRHRALVEREGVRRARAALRRRRHSLRQRRASPHRAWQVRQDTLNQDECELTDMEVSLHRTKSVLGEKVIRLRHIEKSLRQLQAEREGKDPATENAAHKQEHKDTTLSDISSHSSGFSSTEAQSDANPSGRHTTDHDAEIISSLQTLNTEIRDIWQVLNSQQQLNVAKVFPIGQLLYTDVGWQLPIAASNIPTLQHLPNSVATGFAPSANIPAINAIAAESAPSQFRAHGGFRQIPSLPVRPIPTAVVAQPPLPSGVATSLVERTRDLRDWLKQQAAL